MADLLDHLVSPEKKKFGSLVWNPVLYLLVELFAGKAASDHSHGAGGPVIDIGLSTGRPVQQPGFIHVETDTGQVVMYLNAEGTSVAVLVNKNYVDTKPRPIISWRKFYDDPHLPQSVAVGCTPCIRFANEYDARLRFLEDIDLAGLTQRLIIRAMMSTTEAADITLHVAYLGRQAGDSHNQVTVLWAADKAVAEGDAIIARDPDGNWRRYYIDTGDDGTTGSGPPTWPNSGNVADNTATWTAGDVQFMGLSITYPITADAYVEFEIDSADLDMAAENFTDGDQVVGFIMWDSTSAHGGDLHLVEAYLEAQAA